MTVYLLDDVKIIEKPIEPTMEVIKYENRHYDISEEEIQQEMDEAIEDYNEGLEAYNTAMENGFVKGILFNPESYKHKEIFVKIVEESNDESDVRSIPLEKRKMEDCTPDQQIIKIHGREIRKKGIENNKQFEEVVKMIRETEYINTKKTLSVNEMVAFSISLYKNNVDYWSQQKHFAELFTDTSNMSRTEIVENFKKNFKKETFHKLIRFILAQQVHFGECNHTNNLVNISFYNAVQDYYKEKISKIEESYAEKRDKREKRLKERVTALEKEVEALSA